MKQFLRFRGYYCPKRIQPICLFLLTASLLLGAGWHTAFGQEKYTVPDSITPLQIGDTIPEYLWHLPLEVVNHPEGRDTITLDDYRGKLIILDFWSTACKPCIYGLNKLDSIGRLPNPDSGQYAVIPVTAQKKPEIARPLSTYGWSLFTVYSDSLMAEAFPHPGLPHQAWIRDGRVFAIPPPHFATAETIDGVLSGDIGGLHPAMEPFPEPVIHGGAPGFAVISPGKPAYHQQRPRFIEQGEGMAFQIGNVPLVRGLFGFAYGPLVSPHHSWMEPVGSPGSSIRLEVSDSLRGALLPPAPRPSDFASPMAYQQAYDDHVARHHYSYLAYAPGADIDEDAAQMRLREELNAYFGQTLGIQGRVEPRLKTMAYLHLEAPADSVAALLGADNSLKPQPYGRLKQAIREALPDGIPLVDSTALATVRPRWAMAIPKVSSIESLNRHLAPYLLSVRLREEKLPILVISEITDTENHSPITEKR